MIDIEEIKKRLEERPEEIETIKFAYVQARLDIINLLVIYEAMDNALKQLCGCTVCVKKGTTLNECELCCQADTEGLPYFEFDEDIWNVSDW